MGEGKDKNGCVGMIVQWIIGAVVIYGTAWLLPGIGLAEGWLPPLLVALVLGLLNVFVRPILVLLTLPATIVTMGLFLFVINAAIIWLAGWLMASFQVEHFGWALAASVVITIFNAILSALLVGDD